MKIRDNSSVDIAIKGIMTFAICNLFQYSTY